MAPLQVSAKLIDNVRSFLIPQRLHQEIRIQHWFRNAVMASRDSNAKRYAPPTQVAPEKLLSESGTHNAIKKPVDHTMSAKLSTCSLVCVYRGAVWDPDVACSHICGRMYNTNTYEDSPTDPRMNRS